VRGAVELTQAFVGIVTGRPTAEATVYVFGSLDEVLRGYTPTNPFVYAFDVARRLPFTVAEASYGSLVVFTGSEVWQTVNDVERFRIPAHEYFHVLQMNLLGKARADSIAQARLDMIHAGGPVWLFEGTAEFLSWLVIHDTGLADMTAHLNDEAATARQEPLRLTALERPIDYAAPDDVALPHSLLAVTLLMQGREIGDILTFYEALGRGEAWEAAFQRAFRLSVPDFYSQYDAFVREGLRLR
jgi:hypothetical protein